MSIPSLTFENPNQNRLIKYHFVKSDFTDHLSSQFFEDSSYLGVAFKHLKGKVDILATIFKTGITRSGIIEEPHFSRAKTNAPFIPGELDGFDFAFLDKVQLRWLLDLMPNDDDKLCLSDCWIDFGNTPPFNDNKLYLTFKLWVERAENTWKVVKKQKSSSSFPSFTVVPPCPPVWPDIANYKNSYFTFGHQP